MKIELSALFQCTLLLLSVVNCDKDEFGMLRGNKRGEYGDLKRFEMMRLITNVEEKGTGSHYNDPKDGCMPDESAVKISNVEGDFCAPECTSGVCPFDVPDGVSGTPTCALQDGNSGKKFCALICKPEEKNNCGEEGSCKSLGFLGICTYDD